MWLCAERRPDGDCFMAVLSGPQACGRGFQQLPTWLPVGLRNCVRATESAAGSASQVPLPLSPVEGSEPRALVQAGVATGTWTPQAPQGPGPAPSAVHGETMHSVQVPPSAALRIKVFLIIARWQPVSSSGRWSAARGYTWFCRGWPLSVAWMVT